MCTAAHHGLVLGYRIPHLLKLLVNLFSVGIGRGGTLMGSALPVAMTCCVVCVQPNACENRDLNSSSVGLRAGCVSVGMSSVSVLVCLHGVGIA